MLFVYLPRSWGLCKLCGMAMVARGALVGRRSSSGGLVPNGSSISDTSFGSADPGNIGDLQNDAMELVDRRNSFRFSFRLAYLRM